MRYCTNCGHKKKKYHVLDDKTGQEKVEYDEYTGKKIYEEAYLCINKDCTQCYCPNTRNYGGFHPEDSCNICEYKYHPGGQWR